jgi:hypothetical protein
VRQVGGALGVAVLGSILSAGYRSHITPALGDLPEAAREVAAESIGGTRLVAAQLPEAARAALDAASTEAFITAMHYTAAGSALMALLGVAVVQRWLPGRPAPTPVVAALPAEQVAA